MLVRKTRQVGGERDPPPGRKQGRRRYLSAPARVFATGSRARPRGGTTTWPVRTVPASGLLHHSPLSPSRLGEVLLVGAHDVRRMREVGRRFPRGIVVGVAHPFDEVLDATTAGALV